MNIRENLLSISPYTRPGMLLQSVKYIVIHYTGSNGGNADNNRNFFERLKDQSNVPADKIKYASAQYIVDLDGSIVRCIPENEVAWHAGNYNINLNSIGIENCCYDRLNTGSATAGDWYFTDETQNTLVELVKDLMARYNIPVENVIRHYDASGKYCPAMWVKDVNVWNNFKSKLTGNVPTPTPVNPSFNPYQVKITATIRLRKRTSPINGNIVGYLQPGEVVTVINSSDGWGKLEDGSWFSLEYATAYTQPVQTKSVDEIANEVIAGSWGSGEDRKNRLSNAGYDYNQVQARVNEILTGKSKPQPSKSIDDIAREVIAGKWGNGEDRKNRLSNAGYNPSEVQARVNQLL